MLGALLSCANVAVELMEGLAGCAFEVEEVLAGSLAAGETHLDYNPHAAVAPQIAVAPPIAAAHACQTATVGHHATYAIETPGRPG